MRARGPAGQGHAVPGFLPPDVEFHEVSACVASRLILNRISLRLPTGQTTALMGQSGSGKTVLARHLAGDLKPTSGRILIDGEPLWQGTPERLIPAARDFGLMFGANRSYDYFIDRSLPVLDNLTAVLAQILDDPATVADRAWAHAREWDLDGVAEQRTDTVDSITRHRLCLSQAFVADPTLVIVDDPSWAVDIHHIDGEVAAVRDWQRRTGGTILLTTHSIMFAQALAEQIVVLRSGEVVAAGPTADMLRGVVDDESFERRFGARLSVRESDVERLRALGTDDVRWGGSYLDIQRPLSRHAGL